MRYLFILLFVPITVSAQFFESESKIVYGFNIGTHIGNNKTADLYNGFFNPNYNINSILNSSSNLSNSTLIDLLDQRLNTNWKMANVPAPMKYRPGIELGLHAGIQKEKIKYYLDYNFADIKAVGEFFFIENTTNSTLIDPENILASIVGEERRNFINLGIVSNIVSDSEYHLGFPLFFQINQTKFKTNYLVVENQKYTIPNPTLNSINNQNINNQVGSSFGFGTGLVGTVTLNESINFSVAYHIQYSYIKITSDFNQSGIQHSLIARLIWNKE